MPQNLSVVIIDYYLRLPRRNSPLYANYRNAVNFEKYIKQQEDYMFNEKKRHN